MFQWVLSHPLFRAIVIDAAIAFVTFWADPLGLAAQKHRALDNDIAVVTQYLRIAPPKDLAVLLIDQDALREWRVDWPVPYSRMAEIIRALACAHARGVFFDFALTRQFAPAESDAGLRGAVEDSSAGRVCVDGQPPQKIPVSFGKLESADDHPNTWLDEPGRLFLLNAGEDDDIYQSGKEEFPAHPVPVKEASPAFGLMQFAPFAREPSPSAQEATCRDEDSRPQCWRSPLTLVWNGGIDPAQSKVSRTLACRGEIGLFRILASQTPWDAEDRYETCPPVLTLRALDLERDLGYIETYGDPASQLGGRFVLVGVDLPGINDRTLTPVHDYLPGVYKHAVALGALLHYGAHYPTLPSPPIRYGLVLTIYLILETVRHLVAGHRREHWMFAGCFALFAGAFALLVNSRNWPASLLLSVFGYYAAITSALVLSHYATSKAKLHAKTAPVLSAGGKGRKP